MALGSTLTFALIPVLKLARAQPNLCAADARAAATGGKAATRFRVALMTAQIALSMVLLVLAGLFAQSLANAARVDVGFRIDSLVGFSISPERNGYAPARSAELFARLEEDLASIPGVTAVATTAIALLDNSNWNSGVEVEGYQPSPGENMDASMNYVSLNFFRAVEMPLVSGEGFEHRSGGDRAKVAVVNERFVARFGLGDSALGKRLSAMGSGAGY